MRLKRILIYLFMLCCSVSNIAMAAGEPMYNLPYGVTPISQQIYRLHMATFWVCVAIGVVVFSALFYSLYKFRHAKGAKPAQFHEHTGVEIAWTVIPFLILLALAVPATIVLKHIDNTNDPAINIMVKGYQWYWEYKYLDDGIDFNSKLSTPPGQIYGHQKKDKWFLLEVDHPLVVPVGEKIRLLITSNDVIHSWWVPDLGVKQDAIPGYVNTNWMEIEKPGIYRGQCAELCGAFHAFMPIVVKAVPQWKFKQWVAAQHRHHFAKGEAKMMAKARSAEKKGVRS